MPRASVTERFDALYAAHFGFVWGLVRALGVPPGHREDVAQEVWIKAYRKLDLLRPEASARAWLASLTRRTIQHHRRGLGRADRKIRAHAEAREHVTNPYLRFERCQLADAVLAALSEEQRLAFVMVHGEGLSGPEAAQALGISVNTLYSRLRLAHRHLERRATLDANNLVLAYRDEDGRTRAREKICAAVALLVPSSPGMPIGAEPTAVGASSSAVWVGAGIAGVAVMLWGALASGPAAASQPFAGAATELAAVTASLPAPSVHWPDASLAPSPAEQDAIPEVPAPQAEDADAPEAPTPVDRTPSLGSVGAEARATERPRPARSGPAAPEDRADASTPAEAAARPTEPTPSQDAPAVEAEPSAVRDPTPMREADTVAELVDRRREEERQRELAWARQARPVGHRSEGSSLADETALLGRAKAALRSGDPAEALRLLRRYARSFHDGSMADVAAGLRVAALCEAGRDRQARQAARALARQAPHSPLVEEVPGRCR